MAIGEKEFEELVGGLMTRADAREKLVELLDETHAVYAERAASAIVRMRGWILLKLGELGVGEREIGYVIEELDTGREPYLVAAAAHALRSYASLGKSLRPHLERAQTNIRFHDDALRLDRYGGYADAPPFTTASAELLETMRMLDARGTSCCCGPVTAPERAVEGNPANTPALPATRFQDHNGAALEFAEFFAGRPSIVVFFYTRCTNPQKCSLTMTKFGRIGEQLRARGLSGEIRTAAITYDPDFDDADRLRQYAESRSVRLDENHRVLRAVEGFENLRGYFGSGVNFVGSIVNRHRVELYVLDARGRVSSSFQRVLWDETEVIDAAVRELKKPPSDGPPPPVASHGAASPASALSVTLFSIATAFFPKCPMCWAAYLSAFGVAGLERIGYQPWLLPVFIVLMLANLYSLFPRDGSRRRRIAFGLAAAGAITILVPGILFAVSYAPLAGAVLTATGSFLAVGLTRRPEVRAAGQCRPAPTLSRVSVRMQ